MACFRFSILVVFLLLSCSEAREFLVGDSEDSWMIPLPSAEWLNQWPQTQRFRTGDSLTESVLQVKEDHYAKCNTSDSVEKYNDGDTKVVLNRPGHFYFISGAEGHCQEGLNLHVVVMSQSHGGGIHHSPARATAPAPTPVALPPHTSVASSLGVGLMGTLMGFGVPLVMMVFI